MPRELPLFLASAALSLLGACGPKPTKDCPPDEQSACVSSSPGYDAAISSIVNDRCMPCHAPAGVEASVPLTDYKQVFGERMTIGNQLVTCTMPPDGSPQLTDSERKQILDWLTCGAPE